MLGSYHSAYFNLVSGGEIVCVCTYTGVWIFGMKRACVCVIVGTKLVRMYV